MCLRACSIVQFLGNLRHCIVDNILIVILRKKTLLSDHKIQNPCPKRSAMKKVYIAFKKNKFNQP